MRLSNHFRRKWKDFMGWEPTVGEIEEILRGAMKVQQGRTLQLADGSFFTVPAIYFNPSFRVLLKIDEGTKTIITCHVGKPRGNGRRAR